jgi:phosphate-selective porin OprO/OprP
MARIALLCCAWTCQVQAQAPDPQNLLIQRVVLVSTTGAANDPAVNILVRDGVVELVSQDTIPMPEGFVALDAAGGYLMGRIALGEPPSFVILDADPRSDFDVLLDTGKHAVFALHEGRIARNRLERQAPAEGPKASREGLSWLAYTPPPMALPSDYSDPSRFNHWETENTTGAFLVVIGLDRQRWLGQDANSEAQVGDLGFYDGGEIRAFRFGVAGTLNYFKRPWVYSVFGATNAYDKGFETENLDEFAWLDYRLDVPLGADHTLSVGMQKEPISGERLASGIHLPMQERTATADGLLPSRNFGLVLSGSSPGDRFSWATGVFNDFIHGDSSIGSNPTQWVGRLTGVAWSSADNSNLLHLGLGLRYSNAKAGVEYRVGPEFNKAPDFVGTGRIEADSSRLLNLEAGWRSGPFWLSGEYFGQDVATPAGSDLWFTGYNLTGSWMLTGEMRPYNRRRGLFQPVPVARPVNAGGWGALELAARYSTLDLDDGPIRGGEMDVYSLGLNWWLTPATQVSMDYRYISLDRYGEIGHSRGANARLVLMLD